MIAVVVVEEVVVVAVGGLFGRCRPEQMDLSVA